MNAVTDEEYSSINDYVLVYAAKSQLLTYVQSINEELIFIILCQSSLHEEFLSKLNGLNQVHSMFIYSEQNIDNQLIKKYSKLIGTFTDQKLLFEQVRICIEQPVAMRFGFYNFHQKLTAHTKLSMEGNMFFWNVLLKDLLMIEQPRDKNLAIQQCREYYCQNTLEMENIEQFEKTYDSQNSHEWYSKSCFVSKLLTKAFYTADVENLKLLNFFIHDLRSNMGKLLSIGPFYCIRIIEKNQFSKLSEKIGQLMAFSGFLLVYHSLQEVVPWRNEARIVIKFEITNVSTSNVCIVDANRAIIDLGVIFKFSSLDFDDTMKIWKAHLVCDNEGVQISQNYIMIQQQRMERMTLPLIMADLLLKMNELANTKSYLDSLKNEDEALIHQFYGNLYYQKGDYALALDYFQIAYELMLSEERIQDSTFVLHDIGYVYDMKKEVKDALDSHQKALQIRQIYCPPNDILIGISLYNIGRTLVNMNDYSEALISHQQALKIFEQTLPYNHVFLAHSFHSHAVVYHNFGDYTQALEYFVKALELYEVIVPRDEHAILMVKNALETIQKLLP